MNTSVDTVIATHGLKPHPFEGWSIDLHREDSVERQFLWLITAEMFIPWHTLPAEIIWSLHEGAPCAITTSTDGLSASASVVGAHHLPTITIPALVYQTLTTVGRWSLLKGCMRPDIPLTDRQDCPDNWYPRPQNS